MIRIQVEQGCARHDGTWLGRASHDWTWRDKTRNKDTAERDMAGRDLKGARRGRVK
jgi:hypothetical protein